MNPSVDVVVPTLGRDSLARALESVRGQSTSVQNVIVVLDDQSRRGRVSQFLGGETLLVNATRRGGGYSRNRGMQASMAEYICFLDDDDWWSPRKVERQLEVMESGDYGLSFTHSRFYDSRGRVRILPRRNQRSDESLADYLVSRERLRYGDGFLQSSSLMIKRQVAESISWDESLAKHQDWDFIIQAAELAKVKLLDESLVHVEQGSTQSISMIRDWRLSVPFLEKHRSSLSKKGAGDFTASIMLRSAMASLDLRGTIHCVREVSQQRPSFASLLIGFAGLPEGLIRRARS